MCKLAENKHFWQKWQQDTRQGVNVKIYDLLSKLEFHLLWSEFIENGDMSEKNTYLTPSGGQVWYYKKVKI